MAITAVTDSLATELLKDISAGRKGDETAGTMTTKDTGTANSGDSDTDDIIDNSRTRIEEVEIVLRALGILT